MDILRPIHPCFLNAEQAVYTVQNLSIASPINPLTLRPPWGTSSGKTKAIAPLNGEPGDLINVPKILKEEPSKLENSPYGVGPWSFKNSPIRYREPQKIIGSPWVFPWCKAGK